MRPHITIENTVPGTRIPRRTLCKLATVVLRGEHQDRNVNLIFVDDDAMYDLNRKYRGRRRTTDVLSFAMEEDSDPLLGEIYISIPEARRNATEYGISAQREILKLTCHGLLHLCGIHHPTTTDRTRMEARENKYLTAVAGRSNR